MASSSYGEEAMKLIRSLKRSHGDTASPTASVMSIGQYEDACVRNIVQEINHLARMHGQLKAELEEVRRRIPIDGEEEQQAVTKQAELKNAILMHRFALQRNRRALVIYQRDRLDSLRAMAWEVGGGAAMDTGGGMDNQAAANNANHGQSLQPDANGDQQVTGIPMSVRRNMSASEHAFMSSYRRLLEDLRAVYLEVDVAAPLIPPKELFVAVRVLRDIGDVVLESGATVRLTKSRQHFLRRTDVENLITLGYLAPVRL